MPYEHIRAVMNLWKEKNQAEPELEQPGNHLDYYGDSRVSIFDMIKKNLKHFNFDSFSGLGDPEEHLNYFVQNSNIYYYNDLTRCCFFASTLKGGGKEMVQ